MMRFSKEEDQMQQLGQAGRVAVSQALERRYETPNTPSLALDNLPAEISEIDRLATRLVTWRGTDGSIEIARPLTDAERHELTKRANELEPALEPFDRARQDDLDRVAAAAADMYGSFPSMRQEGADAVARVDSLMSALVRRLMPTWAIEQACRSIQDNGYERTDGKKKWTERQWAPSDSEVIRVAMKIVQGRATAKNNAVAILGAKVGR